MTEWVYGWAGRGWRRREGAIENLALWQELVAAAAPHRVQWQWVRGHAGHPQNEYANDLAVRAAKEQTASGGRAHFRVRRAGWRHSELRKRVIVEPAPFPDRAAVRPGAPAAVDGHLTSLGATMDDVERMYRHLVRTIRSTSPQLLTQPFQVGDLYATILPYRLHRRDLGLETNQDYEMAMLELLSGARGYLVVEDRMREVLGASLKSSESRSATASASSRARACRCRPKALRRATTRTRSRPRSARLADRTRPAYLRADARAGPRCDRRLQQRRAAAAPARHDAPPARAARQRGRAPRSRVRDPPRRRAVRRKPITIVADRRELPALQGRAARRSEINFCPHCGQDLTVQHCPACGSELEHGWKFCVTCGRAAAGS